MEYFPQLSNGTYYARKMLDYAEIIVGSFEAGGSYRSPVHAFEGEARYPSLELRTCYLQSPMQSCPQSVCVCLDRIRPHAMRIFMLTSVGTSTFEPDYGFAPSASSATLFLRITKTLPKMLSLPSYTPSILLSNISLRDLLRPPQSSSTLWIPVKRRTA